MKRIGLLSDTHGFFDPLLRIFFENVDEIWHAGDIGNIQTADEIASFRPLIAVCGNIDGAEVRIQYPIHQKFKCEGVYVWMTHIGGYPGNYEKKLYPELRHSTPSLFISGHSHILKVMHDKKLQLLHINPGAAGKQGFHKFRTAVRFMVTDERIHDLEVWEIARYTERT